MLNAQLQKILAQLENHEKRIRALEGFNPPSEKTVLPIGSKKEITLAELIRGKSFRSGQQKVAIIVGYYEKISKRSSIREIDIKAGWVMGKFDGKYRSNLLERAVKDGLVRDLENGTFDMSQTGEKFFSGFLK